VRVGASVSPITMSAIAILAAVCLSPYQDSTPYSQPQAVAEPARLAQTPNIDGVLSPGEWDGFAKSNEGETYLQWEPNRLYVAAKMPLNRDLVISVDTKRNGWLVGKDNLEFRVRATESGVSVIGRQLDATNVSGPVWIAQPGYTKASFGKAKIEGDQATVEACIIDPGIGLLTMQEGERYMVRADVVAQSSQQVEPFYPRVGADIRFAMERASALPVGLNWKVESWGREVTPGHSTKIRFSFSSKEDVGLKKLEIKPVGSLAEHAGTLGLPFPRFDKKGRAFVDYETNTNIDAPTGYQLVNGTLITADGAPAVIQASFRIAPLIDFTLSTDKLTPYKKGPETKLAFFINSNSINRLDGQCDVKVPNGWEILKGDQKSFIIYNSRGGVRRVLTLQIPAEAKGTFPIRFRGQVGHRAFEEVRWVTIA
jgi:hypothetical protein